METNNGKQLFRSFWQAGFECSTHKLKSGKRLDETAITRHDRWADEDFSRLKAFDICSVREGLRWHLIEKVPGQYEFSSVLPILEAANRHGVEIQWDLLHFGWPDHLDVFSEEWLNSFGRLAHAFGEMLKQTSLGKVFVAPVNEISFLSWAGGDAGYLNPFEVGRGADLKQQLVKAYLRAVAELKSVYPEVRLISPDPVIHIVGDPQLPDDVKSANEYRLAMFEAWDMIAGRSHPDLGGSEAALDIIGVNYYDRNQWRNFGETLPRTHPEYRPFGNILDEVYQRYKRPLYVSETGTENEERPGWLAYIAQEVAAALARGTPVEGICLYPILNHPGWDDDRHCHNGLWDYADDEGHREIYQPMAAELVRQQSLHRGPHATIPTSDHPDAAASGGSTLPLPPAMEFRLPAPATSDGEVCQTTPGFLLGGAAV